MKKLMEQRSHKTQLKAFKVFRSYCQQKGCKYFGEHAVQGHCFHKPADHQVRFIEEVSKEAEGLLKSMQAIHKRSKNPTQQGYIRYLEGHLVSQWMNRQFTLHELIYRRAESAKLAHKIKMAGG